MDKPITYLAYRRKSTDDDRQVLSLDSQETEIKQKFHNLKIIFMEPESVSAFKPDKRPVFKKMIEMIEAGKAQGIIAWHPDRLSRNPIDAAQIIYMVDTGKLTDLKFCSYYFDNSAEGKMMLAMTMSQSKYSSDKLSTDIKRGINKKATAGERPAKTPLGYLNSKTNVQGTEINTIDPERFHLVRKLWDRLLTGNHSIPQILKYANEDLLLTQPATQKLPVRKLRLGMLYSTFQNAFFYGWYEWPEGSGNWVKGNHQPMVSQIEFEDAQRIMGRRNRPRPKTHNFAFTGLMRCGTCGAMVTAEEKHKRLKNGKVLHYVYYHCTKRLDPKCTEKSVEVKELTNQIDQVLGTITISDRFSKWAVKYLHEMRKGEVKTQEQVYKAKQNELTETTQQLDSLLLKFTSSQNIGGKLISDDEFQMLKGRLLKQRSSLEAELITQGKNQEEWIELSERTFNFARYARIWFAQGDIDIKRSIFACLGSKLVLKDRKLSVTLKKPFEIIFEGLPQAERELLRLETLDNATTAIDKIGQNSKLTNPVFSWSR